MSNCQLLKKDSVIHGAG